MSAHEYEMEGLAFRAGRGDPQAKVTLRQQLEPEIVRMVRRTLKSGMGTHPLARKALAEARRLGPQSPAAEPTEHLIFTVARRVLETVMATATAAARPQRWATETVVA
jgi:hypothetical protein